MLRSMIRVAIVAVATGFAVNAIANASELDQGEFSLRDNVAYAGLIAGLVAVPLTASEVARRLLG